MMTNLTGPPLFPHGRCLYGHHRAFHRLAGPRFQEMVDAITSQADADRRYTADSMYLSWKGWSFADKKNPSPWLTLLVLRIIKRIPSATA